MILERISQPGTKSPRGKMTIRRNQVLVNGALHEGSPEMEPRPSASLRSAQCAELRRYVCTKRLERQQRRGRRN